MRGATYKSFEEKFRGSRELVKRRLKAYEHLLRHMQAADPAVTLLDLGCGRGEWLEFAAELGIPAQGIDTNEHMLKDCRDRGFFVERGDALTWLKRVPDSSQTIVSAFHLIEHLPFLDLEHLISEAYRALKPNGLLLLETPNTENIRVAISNFYLDPTHNNPLPSSLMVFLAEFCGFEVVRSYPLNGPALPEGPISFWHVLDGVGADYCVLAFKSKSVAMPPESCILPNFRAPSLFEIAARFDGSIAARLPLPAAQTTSAQVEDCRSQVLNEFREEFASLSRLDEKISALSERVGTIDGSARILGERLRRVASIIDAGEFAPSLEASQRIFKLDLPRQPRDAHAEHPKQRTEEPTRPADDLQLQFNNRTLAGVQNLLEAQVLRQQALEVHVADLRKQLARVISTQHRGLGWIKNGAVAWLTFRPHSRPHRIARQAGSAMALLIRGARAWLLFVPGSRPRRSATALLARLRPSRPPLGVLSGEGTIRASRPSRAVVPRVDFRRSDPTLPKSVAVVYERLLQACAYATSLDLERGSQKPRLAYVSPLPPLQSGISDYSAHLLKGLAAYYEIEVITDQTVIADTEIVEQIAIKSRQWFQDNYPSYDRVLYHVGNSGYHAHMVDMLEKFPGVVALHDFFLGHLMADIEQRSGVAPRWVEALFQSHGIGAVADRLHGPTLHPVLDNYPANLPILLAAQGVLVHSNHAVDLARAHYGDDIAERFFVVPFSRADPGETRRADARKSLGIADDEFVVCSFGMLGRTKMNQDLLLAWLTSALVRDEAARLIFVGEADPSDPYAAELRNLIVDAGAFDQVKLTGYVDKQFYSDYLHAADMAVQLRTLSRGETSAAVFDCLAHGLPTILNAAGSLREIPPETAIVLPEKFTIEHLASQLVLLRDDSDARAAVGLRARAWTREFGGSVGAKRYHAAMESFETQSTSALSVSTFKRAAKSLHGSSAEPERLLETARLLANANRRRPGGRQLLVDVSALADHDLKSGIQRVVRAQLLALLRNPPKGWRVEPIKLVQDPHGAQYVYARSFLKRLYDLPVDIAPDHVIDVAAEDILYFPDLHHVATMKASEAGIYRELREAGVKIHSVVYDLLPIQRPEWFPDGAAVAHERWLTCAAQASDSLICISESVADDVNSWLCSRFDLEHALPRVAALHLGADIESSAPTFGVPDSADELFTRMDTCLTFLAVGTIEPRKGYQELLSAFEKLWGEGLPLNLIIVGAEGWKALASHMRRTIPEIVSRLKSHAELNRRLFWLEQASDEYLAHLYRTSTCLIVASEGEGFGLPIIEAALHGLPVLARDLPVFREVGKDGVTYFSTNAPDGLAKAIKNWLKLRAARKLPDLSNTHTLTWAENVSRLQDILLRLHA